MKFRAVLVGLVVVVATVALWHPAAPVTQLAVTASAPPPSGRHHRHVASGLPQVAAVVAVVYVTGAVRKPGLYRIVPSARADDAVRAAGGLTPNADPEGVNLAAYVHDGDEVLVPVLGQAIGKAAQRRARSPRGRSRKAVLPVALVDVNTADAATLATLPGIGPTLAARIVAVRERDGPYRSPDQLLDVAGMSQARLDRIGSYLRI